MAYHILDAWVSRVRNGAFEGYVRVRNGAFEGHVRVRNGAFEGHVRVRNGAFEGHVRVRNGAFEGHVPLPGHPAAPMLVVATWQKRVVSHIARVHSNGHTVLSLVDVGIEASTSARVVLTPFVGYSALKTEYNKLTTRLLDSLPSRRSTTR